MDLTTYKIYQIPSSKLRELDAVSESESYLVRTFRDLILSGPKAYQPEMFKAFSHVATLTIEGGLEDVFRILNIGPRDNEVYVHANHDLTRSLSVGDIVYNETTGEYWMVASFGFEIVEV